MNNLFEYKDCFSEFKDVKSHLVLGDLDNKSPKVSILMPVYSHYEYFEKALTSAIQQDYQDDYEIVIVDNNPLDDTITEYQKIIERANTSKILYYRNEQNIGLFGNWNRCVELARSEFVTFLHDDDVLQSNCLTVLMEASTRYGRKLIFPEQNIINETGEVVEESVNLSSRYGIFKLRKEYSIDLLDKFIRNRGCGVGCLYSKSGIIELGGYNKVYDPSSDYALNIRYVDRFGAIAVSECLINYRRAVNYSFDCFNRWPDMDKSLRESILKRKKIYNILTKMIVKSFFSMQCIIVYEQFGRNSNGYNVNKSPNVIDKFIYNLICRISRLKCFTLNV